MNSGLNQLYRESIKAIKKLSKSKKGVETTPLTIILSAIILVLTAGIVFPAMQEWEWSINYGKTLKEAIRLRDTINEISAMGDYGSIERIDLDIPDNFYLKVDNNAGIGTDQIHVCYVKPNKYGCPDSFDLKRKVQSSSSEIRGKTTLMISYWPSSGNKPHTGGGNQIFIYK